MASLDLTKAFDSVAIDAISRGAAKKGCSKETLDYLREFYSTSTTVLEGKTLLVHPSRGVRQGDPLSPLLFNMVLDEWLGGGNSGIQFESGDWCLDAMAFADDVVLLATTPQGLQLRIDSFTRFLRERGLVVNPAKSLSVALQPSGREKKVKLITTPLFKIDGDFITAAKAGTEWRYLGVFYAPFGQKRPSVQATLETLLERVSRAPLRPQQRLVILRYYLLPRLYHSLVLSPLTASLLKKMDILVRSAVRRWLHLPHDVAKGFFHAAMEDGGLGIPSMRTLIPAMQVRRLEKLTTSTLPACQEAVKLPLIDQRLRTTRRLTFLDGKDIGTKAKSQRFWAQSLHASVDGCHVRDTKNMPAAMRWSVEGTSLLRGKDYINLIKLRMNALPCLSRTKRGRDVNKTCRAGCNAEEVLGHILQICPRSHHARIRRHDVMVRYLASRLREKGWDVLVEPHFTTSLGRQIPDLVLKREGQAVILDVQVVGLRVTLQDAHAAKRAKYLNIDLHRQISDGPVLVMTCTTSFRGCWAKASVQNLQDLGLGKKDFTILTLRCLQGGLRAFNDHQRMTLVSAG